MLYSEKVMDHFRNPRNVGEIAGADGIGEVGNAKCGDIMRMYIKVKDNIITDVKFMTFGFCCGDNYELSEQKKMISKYKVIQKDEEKSQSENSQENLTNLQQNSANSQQNQANSQQNQANSPNFDEEDENEILKFALSFLIIFGFFGKKIYV